VESTCELGNEPSVSIKMLGIYRVAAQLVASRVVLSYTELVSYFKRVKPLSLSKPLTYLFGVHGVYV
jgi:hypothetical protein